jgi:hypothetical protein
MKVYSNSLPILIGLIGSSIAAAVYIIFERYEKLAKRQKKQTKMEGPTSKSLPTN